MEQVVHKTLEQYDMLAKATSDTIWDWDIATGNMYYNYGIEKMFGYSLTRIENIQSWWDSKIHPEDKERIHELLCNAFLHRTQHLKLEYRFLCKSGQYKNILDRASVIYNGEGKAVRMIGAMQDITRQVEEEDRINKAIIEVQEKERQEIGMELHDNVNQVLSAVLLCIGVATRNTQVLPEVHKTLELGRGYMIKAINDIRHLSHQLAPASFEFIPLEELVTSLLETVNISKLYKTHLIVSGLENIIITESLQTTIYRILQEQLNNIGKYASASRVEVVITATEHWLCLSITDNGKGFDIKKVKPGIGIENIQRRIKLCGGRFNLQSAPGKGCEIIAEFPVALKQDRA